MKRPLRKHRSTRQDNVKMGLIEPVCDNADSAGLAWIFRFYKRINIYNQLSDYKFLNVSVPWILTYYVAENRNRDSDVCFLSAVCYKTTIQHNISNSRIEIFHSPFKTLRILDFCSFLCECITTNQQAHKYANGNRKSQRNSGMWTDSWRKPTRIKMGRKLKT